MKHLSTLLLLLVIGVGADATDLTDLIGITGLAACKATFDAERRNQEKDPEVQEECEDYAIYKWMKLVNEMGKLPEDDDKDELMEKIMILIAEESENMVSVADPTPKLTGILACKAIYEIEKENEDGYKSPELVPECELYATIKLMRLKKAEGIDWEDNDNDLQERVRQEIWGESGEVQELIQYERENESFVGRWGRKLGSMIKDLGTRIGSSY